LTTIVNRRYARDLGPAPARGPGASLDALTWVGWASVLSAFGFLVFGLRPLTELGDPRFWDWSQIAFTVLESVRNATVVALPAALEWGVPWARRRTPWLMRGVVLLAVEQLARPVLEVAREQYLERVPEAADLYFDTPVGLALVLVSLGVSVLGIAGVWALSDGLSDAGARPRRAIVVGVVAAGTALALYAYLPLYGFFTEGVTQEVDRLLWWLNLGGLLLGFADIALWLMVGVRLVAGLPFGLRPRRAWVLAAVAGACVIGRWLLASLLPLANLVGSELSWSLSLVTDASWVLLLIAFAAGLGRGRERREERPRRMRLYVLHPTD
jgi:hypothetical protein